MTFNFARRFGLLVLVGLTVTPIAYAQAAASYAPGKLRYHVVTVLSRSQPLGGGRAPFDFTTTTHEWIGVEMGAAAHDTLPIEMTVDSIRITSTLDAPQPETKIYQGAKFKGTMSPRGQIYALQPVSDTTDKRLNAFAARLKPFFIPLPKQTLAAGASWADTVVQHPRVNQIDITSSSVTTYKVAGDTTVHGQRAWRIDRFTTIAQLGKGTEAGQPLEISGSGTITGVHFFSPSGVMLGGQSTQRTDIMEKMNESEGAPIQQTFKSTVELIPSGS